MAFDNLFNPELIRLAREAAEGGGKSAFVSGGDPALMGAPGGMPPGGAPPGDPSAGGPPPDAGGGAPPPDPTGDRLASIEQLIRQMQQNGAAGGGGVEPIKPKIDQPTVLMQILKIVCRIAEGLQIHIPPHELVMTGADLTQTAQQQQQAPAGAIPPIQGIGGLQPSGVPGQGAEKTSSFRREGTPFVPHRLDAMTDRAAAILKIRQGAGTAA